MDKVLINRPYHYHHWMVILQRWEPVISSTFPSHIPFWIRVQGLPLHYWHEKMTYHMAHELGHLEKFQISKTSFRLQVTIDGLKPLLKESLLEFDTGEDLMVSFVYEDLKSHCTTCFKLTHLAEDCPLATRPQQQSPKASDRDPQRAPHRGQENRYSPTRDPFHQRVDRHGRPFGNRVPLPPPRGNPLKNKLAPAQQPREPNQDDRVVDQRTSRQGNHHPQQRDESRRQQATNHKPQWREKVPVLRQNVTIRDKSGPIDSNTPPPSHAGQAQPLERNLAYVTSQTLQTYPEQRTSWMNSEE